MASSYKRRDRLFEVQIAKRADELRSKREAEQLTEIMRELQDELIPVLVMLWGNGENFGEEIR